MDARDLEARVLALEEEVVRLRAQMTELNDLGLRPQHRPASTAPPPVAGVTVGPTNLAPAKASMTAADVIARLGIALLLLGVAFLLKLTIDYGWLTEGVRVAMGGLLGLALLGGGLALGDSRRSLGAVLMGGGTVSLYATVFAAHVLYGFIPLEVAFGMMGGVTVLGTALALKQNYSAISAITALGGLITPFLLAQGDPAAGLLAIHSAILVAGLSGVYAIRGWGLVQALNVFGGGTSLAVAVGLQNWDAGADGTMTTLAGVVFGGLAMLAGGMLRKDVNTTDRFTLVTAPLLTLALVSVATGQVATVVSSGVAGLVLMGLALVGGNRRLPLGFASAGAGMVTVLSALSVEPIAAVLGAYALSLNAVSFKEDGESGLLRVPGFLATVVLGIWCLVTMVDRNVGLPFWNADGLLLALGVGVLVGTGWTQVGGMRWLYFHTGLVAAMAMIYDQLQGAYLGEVLTTGLWGLMGVVYVAVGIAKDRGQMQVAGVLVMLATAGKLLFFDLDTVATIWRVILFMGFGAVLLGMSFVFSKRAPEIREAA